MSERNWTGYLIVIPEQHSLVITGIWRKDRPHMWWWKCSNCIESSGVISTTQLERLDEKGMIAEFDGKMPAEYSRHPKENNWSDEEYYGWM